MSITRRVLMSAAASAALVLSLGAAAARAADVSVTIGYQPIVEPSRVPQAAGTYEKVTVSESYSTVMSYGFVSNPFTITAQSMVRTQ